MEWFEKLKKTMNISGAEHDFSMRKQKIKIVLPSPHF